MTGVQTCALPIWMPRESIFRLTGVIRAPVEADIAVDVPALVLAPVLVLVVVVRDVARRIAISHKEKMIKNVGIMVVFKHYHPFFA